MEQENKEPDKSTQEQEKVSVEAVEEDFVASAQKIAKELKEGLAERVKILEREERLIARQEVLRQLGGGSLAGQAPVKPAVETAKEYADRVLSGKIK